MNITPVISASLMIGSTIFMYIVALIAILAFFGYLVYRTSPKGKEHRAARHERRHNK